jgi:ribose/xylose/arabinose/galactoside ABC-type transport system permease subunit
MSNDAPNASRLRLPALSGPVVGLVLVLVLFVVLILAKGGQSALMSFLSLRNLQVLVQEGTIPAVLALGMLLVIVSGGIDLSIGSVVALVTVVAMQVYRWTFDQTGSTIQASLCAVPAGIAVGGACGLTSGLLVTGFRIPPFVVTLGMMSIARGLAFWISGRTQLAFPRGGRPEWVDLVSEVHPATIFNVAFWSLVVLAAVVALLLRYSILGRYAYAIGSNEAAARLCGVPIERYKILIYSLAGLLTGWAGILFFARGNAGDPSGGKELELKVIAAVVIGGASLKGGIGTVSGALLGVLIIEILGNGVNNFNVPVDVQFILIGLIIVANTAIGQRREHDQS